MKYTITFTSKDQGIDEMDDYVRVFKSKDDMISYLLDFVDDCSSWMTGLVIE